MCSGEGGLFNSDTPFGTTLSQVSCCWMTCVGATSSTGCLSLRTASQADLGFMKPFWIAISHLRNQDGTASAKIIQDDQLRNQEALHVVRAASARPGTDQSNGVWMTRSDNPWLEMTRLVRYCCLRCIKFSQVATMSNLDPGKATGNCRGWCVLSLKPRAGRARNALCVVTRGFSTTDWPAGFDLGRCEVMQFMAIRNGRAAATFAVWLESRLKVA